MTKKLKVAIQPNPIGFTSNWIEYCEKNKIEYKLVDATNNNIISELNDCDLFIWNHDLLLQVDNLLAKRLLMSLEHSGKKVFPDFNCGWHYDDKLGQKYLLESIGAPIVDTYVFYDKQTAKSWLEGTSFPKVFKLKGGASSINVKLIKTKKEGLKLINKAFGSGFKPNNKLFYLKESFRKYSAKEINALALLKSIFRFFFPVKYKPIVQSREVGYAYFQDFIPNNKSDIRLVVINMNRIFGLERFNRKGDFRASGSGNFKYLKEGDVANSLLKMVLDVSKGLKMDSVAYDIVFTPTGEPKIVEISYSYVSKAYNLCPGYWDESLVWVPGDLTNYQDWIIEKQIKDIQDGK